MRLTWIISSFVCRSRCQFCAVLFLVLFVNALAALLRFFFYNSTCPALCFVQPDFFSVVYVNHRPVKGVSKRAIEEAFAVLGAESVAGLLDIDTLLSELKQKGAFFRDLYSSWTGVFIRFSVIFNRNEAHPS